MSPDEKINDVSERLRRLDERLRREHLARNVLAAIVLISLFAMGILWYQTSTAQDQTDSSLCTFTDDLAARIEAGEAQLKVRRAYLEAHPEPLILGVTRVSIVASAKAQELLIAGQIRTQKSLSGLNC